jgi:hypothetical protein
MSSNHSHLDIPRHLCRHAPFYNEKQGFMKHPLKAPQADSCGHDQILPTPEVQEHHVPIHELRHWQNLELVDNQIKDDQQQVEP